QLGSVLGGEHWTTVTFQRSDRSIVVDGNDQEVRLLRRRLEVPHVANVKQIETAVGKRNAPSRRSRIQNTGGERLSRQDLTHARVSSPARCTPNPRGPRPARAANGGRAGASK